MDCRFVNIKNEKTYEIVGFVTVKVGDIWRTAISYIPESSGQIFVRFPEDFFLKFVPKSQWDSANSAQQAKLKGNKNE